MAMGRSVRQRFAGSAGRERRGDRANIVQIDGAPIAYQSAMTGSQIAQPNDEIGANGMMGFP